MHSTEEDMPTAKETYDYIGSGTDSCEMIDTDNIRRVFHNFDSEAFNAHSGRRRLPWRPAVETPGKKWRQEITTLINWKGKRARGKK